MGDDVDRIGPLSRFCVGSSLILRVPGNMESNWNNGTGSGGTSLRIVHAEGRDELASRTRAFCFGTPLFHPAHRELFRGTDENHPRRTVKTT